MTISITLAFALCLLAFVIHTFMGDAEVWQLQPQGETIKLRSIWTMTRCGWHWISYDLLLASIGLGLINFSELLPHESFLLDILTVYFAGYGLVWLVTIAISPSFRKNYLMLGQWMLLWLIALLIWI